MPFYLGNSLGLVHRTGRILGVGNLPRSPADPRLGEHGPAGLDQIHGCLAAATARRWRAEQSPFLGRPPIIERRTGSGLTKNGVRSCLLLLAMTARGANSAPRIRTEFEYDSRGNLVLTRYPDLSTETTVYDPVNTHVKLTPYQSFKIDPPVESLKIDLCG